MQRSQKVPPRCCMKRSWTGLGQETGGPVEHIATGFRHFWELYFLFDRSAGWFLTSTLLFLLLLFPGRWAVYELGGSTTSIFQDLAHIPCFDFFWPTCSPPDQKFLFSCASIVLSTWITAHVALYGACQFVCPSLPAWVSLTALYLYISNGYSGGSGIAKIN